MRAKGLIEEENFISVEGWLIPMNHYVMKRSVFNIYVGSQHQYITNFLRSITA
jgi:hypothetical protein